MAQSRTIQRRLRDDLGVRADVLWPPPPPRAYRCDEYGDYILAVSRLTPMKRLDLLIRALAEPAAKHVRVVIAGDGESRSDLETLAAAAGSPDASRSWATSTMPPWRRIWGGAVPSVSRRSAKTTAS